MGVMKKTSSLFRVWQRTCRFRLRKCGAYDLHNADAALEFAMSLSNAIHLLQARTQLAHEHLFEDVR